MNSNFGVSVCMITYNHEAYIAQAIEGVLLQKTDFPIELVIGDDCSTDKTAKICLEYKNLYPDQITLIARDKTVGMMANFSDILQSCQGKYIALCEGDDYWTDPEKLQKQVNFLEANEEFAISFHSVKVVYEDGSSPSHVTNIDQPAVTEFEDLAKGNFIYTASCLFRKENLVIPPWFEQISVGDWALHLINAARGKIGFLENVMAVYRIHHGGVWGMKKTEERYLRWINVVQYCRDYFYPHGNRAFCRQLAEFYGFLCFTYFQEGRFADCRKAYRSLLPYVKYMKARSFVSLTNRYVASFFPKTITQRRAIRASLDSEILK